MIKRTFGRRLMASTALALMASQAALATDAEPTNLYWGDTHLHTSYSFDAFLNENRSADPDTAYRWARGMPVIHPYNRARVQLAEPLDFLVVSDHAELMGAIRGVYTDSVELPEMSLWQSIKRWYMVGRIKDAVDEGTGPKLFARLLPVSAENPGGDPVKDPNNTMARGFLGDTRAIEQTAWNEIAEAADRHNDPGKFTAMIGWEWSSIPTGANLHRVVISSTDGETAKQFLPYGSDDSQYPEDLWKWLEDTGKRTGAEFLAIPHNSNISKGYMFAETTLKGQPITADYARTRAMWEPVTEVTQTKGDSETHPSLSPDDEFAEFETYGFYIQQSGDYTYEAKPGDYIRPALKAGLKIEGDVGVNPYKFGLIGSTDSHSGLSSADEDNFWGKMARDSTPETKKGGRIGGSKVNGWNMSASGLAAVWAPENTREAIFQAFKRREVYATSGPRIRLRVFGGWDFSGLDSHYANLAEVGYASGVPMGGDLMRPTDTGTAPKLLIQAVRDPRGANLDRVQVVKGWLDESGATHETVFDVAWSDDRAPGADGKLPAVGDTVDRNTGKVANTIGTPEMITLWTDPTFNANERAFYYVRVLQIPTARHSLLDGIALQTGAPEEGPEVIQERAYSSPIWYTP